MPPKRIKRTKADVVKRKTTHSLGNKSGSLLEDVSKPTPTPEVLSLPQATVESIVALENKALLSSIVEEPKSLTTLKRRRRRRMHTSFVGVDRKDATPRDSENLNRPPQRDEKTQIQRDDEKKEDEDEVDDGVQKCVNWWRHKDEDLRMWGKIAAFDEADKKKKKHQGEEENEEKLKHKNKNKQDVGAGAGAGAGVEASSGAEYDENNVDDKKQPRQLTPDEEARKADEEDASSDEDDEVTSVKTELRETQIEEEKKKQLAVVLSAHSSSLSSSSSSLSSSSSSLSSSSTSSSSSITLPPYVKVWVREQQSHELFRPLSLHREQSFLIGGTDVRMSMLTALRKSLYMHAGNWSCVALSRSDGPTSPVEISGNARLIPIIVPPSLEALFREQAYKNREKCDSCAVLSESPCIRPPRGFAGVDTATCNYCTLTFKLNVRGTGDSETDLTTVTSDSFRWIPSPWLCELMSSPSLPLSSSSSSSFISSSSSSSSPSSSGLSSSSSLPPIKMPYVAPGHFICTLARGQPLEITMTAMKGSMGTHMHSSFQPITLCSAVPTFKVVVDPAKLKSVPRHVRGVILSACTLNVFGVTDLEDLTDMYVKNSYNCNGCKHCIVAAQRLNFPTLITVERDHIIKKFRLQTSGVVSPQYARRQALESMRQRISNSLARMRVEYRKIEEDLV